MGMRMGSLFPVMIVIIESGALYTSGIIAFLCTYLAGSNGQYPALDLITPLVVRTWLDLNKVVEALT